jgi:hypothetical protein
LVVITRNITKDSFTVSDRRCIEGHLRVNMALAQTMAKNNSLRELAVFLKLKSLNKKSIIYNYTQQKLSNLSGMSRSAIRKYIKFFLSNGWCDLHHGNLVFRKLFKFDPNKQKLITPINIQGSVKDILSSLYLMILQKKQLQFEKFKSLKDALYLTHDSFRAKKARWLVEKLNLDEKALPSPEDNMKLSIIGMAKLFGKCSKSKAHSVIKHLKQSKAVKCIVGKRTVIKTANKHHAAAYIATHKNCYSYKGLVWKVECNSYIF